MTIQVVTDSTADLPTQTAKDYNITVVPLYINIEGKSYLDGVELSRQEFYQRLPDLKSPPLTSAPGPEIFRQVYEKLAAQGATEVLSLHISASLSATYNIAQAAAQTTKAVPVTTFDPGQLTLGTGLLVIEAAKAAAAGQSMAEIVAMLAEKSRRTHTMAALDTLEFLRRSGRVSHLAYGLGALLSIKPLLTMHSGEMGMERVRTRRKAIERLLEMLSELGPFEELAMVHTYAPERAETLHAEAQHFFPLGRPPIFSSVTPIIGAHIGPGAVGFVGIRAKTANGKVNET
ncbi:MAG: DegV family protein [Chloroflexota bacterium]